MFLRALEKTLQINEIYEASGRKISTALACGGKNSILFIGEFIVEKSDGEKQREFVCAEEAALQMIGCLFSTVQISVRLEERSAQMKSMLLFWMAFMRNHVELLQKTQIMPMRPENLYSEVRELSIFLRRREDRVNILIIEDDAAIRQELKLLLENALYQVTALTEFGEAAEAIINIQPDLVLLDVNLPEESGFAVCRKVREVSQVPIIFVTSRTDSMDELEGMLKGGDDYITKPFNAPVLLARIAAVLKRTRKENDEDAKLIHKGAELDPGRGQILYQGEQADLTKNELKILYFLFQRKSEIVSRMDLVEYLWDQQVFIDDNALSVNVTRLRGKLEEIGLADFIETKRGMGYRI